MKRILPLFLAVMLFVSGLTFSVSAQEESFENIKTILAQLGVMNGDPDGSFRPDDNVTRAEFAKIAIMASPYRDFVASGMNTSPFADVSFTHWAAPYIKLASSNKIITGYPDSTYRPEENVLMEEAVTVVVKMLGYTDEDFKASWPYGHIGVATNIGLLDGIDTGMGECFSRRDVAKLLYNTLKGKPKGGASSAEFINSLGYSFVENVTILATAKENSSVGSNKVSTSNGTYKINEYFDYGIVGNSGDILVNTDSNELLLFFGKDIRTESYVIDSVLDDEIIAVKDGNKVSLRISDNVDTYFKLQNSTLGSVKKSFKEGYTLTVAYDLLGNVEYLKVDDKKYQGMVDDITEVNYNVYSVLNGEILAYKDGNLVSLKLPDDLTVYDDSTTTSYAAIKNSLGTGYFLAVGYDGTNTAKYAKVVDEKLSGPVVVEGSFAPSMFSLSSTPTVMRDGNKSSAAEIAKYDVLYYSQSLDTVWAYSKKVSGTFESASPSRDNVTSVTIAGKSYNIETADASIALSSSGDFVLGDTITVLLGKNGEIAGVVKPEDVKENIFGFVKEVGTTQFNDDDGNVITSKYVELLHTDGTLVKYRTKNAYNDYLNSVVKLTIENNLATVRSLNTKTDVSGVVNYSKGMIGNTNISKNVNIVEISKTKKDDQFDKKPLYYGKVFFKRLDGMSISKSKIVYAEKNHQGEVTDIILINVTGDIYDYGIVSEKHDIDTEKTYNVDKYEVDANGNRVKVEKKAVRMEQVAVKVKDDQGNPVLDDDGNEKVVIETKPVKDSNGNEIYDTVIGPDGKPVYEQVKETIKVKGGSFSGFIGSSYFNFSASNVYYTASTGQPVQVIMKNNTIQEVISLAKVYGEVSLDSSINALVDGKSYRISDKCNVYDETYSLISINNILNNDSLKCELYVDKYSNTVRVIKARKK